jgi:anti-sigma factor RsiW
MTCDRVSEIHALHDGELTGEAALAAEGHLAQCEACSELLADLRGLTALVAAAELREMRPMAVGRFYDAWTEARDRGLVRITSWLTAAAAAVLIGALWLWPVAETKTTASRPGMWETVAIVPPAETQAESNSELVQVAQWMADDLSLGGERR